jgi:hypothetical protein
MNQREQLALIALASARDSAKRRRREKTKRRAGLENAQWRYLQSIELYYVY